MMACLRILILNCFFFSAAIQLAGQDYTKDFEDGLALVTTCKGGVMFKSPGGKAREAELHAVESLTGAEITSGEGEHIFFSLSNGSALGVYEHSQVQIESYGQQPFPPEKESIGYEPSRSELVIRLNQGSVSFSAGHLSPLSVILIKLPVGQIEIRKASGRVLYGDRGALVMLTSGIVSFISPGMQEEEFIHSPNAVRISGDPSQPGRISLDTLPDPYPAKELTRLLVNATHRAGERVIYKVPTGQASIPRPALVAKPETLLKPTPRPYIYLD